MNFRKEIGSGKITDSTSNLGFPSHTVNVKCLWLVHTLTQWQIIIHLHPHISNSTRLWIQAIPPDISDDTEIVMHVLMFCMFSYLFRNWVWVVLLAIFVILTLDNELYHSNNRMPDVVQRQIMNCQNPQIVSLFRSGFFMFLILFIRSALFLFGHNFKTGQTFKRKTTLLLLLLFILKFKAI